MESIFIGIDISKDHLDVALCDSISKEASSAFTILNSAKSIKSCLIRLVKVNHGKRLWVCFEHTGNYGLLLSHILEELKITFTAVSALEILRSIGLTRGKDDQIDAQRIAIYAAVHQHKLKPTVLPSSILLKIKQLVASRRLFVKTRSAYKNHLKSIRITQQSINVTSSILALEEQINNLDNLVKSIEAHIFKLIKSDDSLLKNYQKVVQVKGVGKLTATYILLYTNNFSSFSSPRKFNCFCGLAPFARSSGSSLSKKPATSNLRNRTMKALLFNCANTAIRSDPQLKAYYKRKINEGKNKLSVINAVACKLIARIFAVVKREEPFIIFNH